MNTSKNLDVYKENIASDLKKHVKIKQGQHISKEKNIFKKTVLQNVVIQEIFEFMGKDKDMQPEIFSSYNSGNSTKEIYDMYTLLYNTMHYYSIDELKIFRTQINDLTQKKKNYVTNIEKAKNEKDEIIHKEKYLMGLLGDQNSVFNEKSSDSENTSIVVNNYASFFSIFKITEANIPIIDISTFSTFVDRI